MPLDYVLTFADGDECDYHRRGTMIPRAAQSRPHNDESTVGSGARGFRRQRSYLSEVSQSAFGTVMGTCVSRRVIIEICSHGEFRCNMPRLAPTFGRLCAAIEEGVRRPNFGAAWRREAVVGVGCLVGRATVWQVGQSCVPEITPPQPSPSKGREPNHLVTSSSKGRESNRFCDLPVEGEGVVRTGCGGEEQ